MAYLRSLFSYLFYYIYGGVASARRKGVTVGSDCRIYIYSFGSEPFLINIGDEVTITKGVRLLTHDGSTCLIRNDNGVRFQKYMPIDIGNCVFIGINSIVMPGVSIGDKTIVGAGSVVTKSLKGNAVYAGNPARYLCSFEEYSVSIKAQCPDNTALDLCVNYKDRVDTAVRILHEKTVTTKKI